MTPVAIIELQRRLTLVGAIRAGAEKPERGPGKRLEKFRLTSPRQQLVEQAAGLYGGTVSPWQSPVGQEWQVYTQAAEIPVLVMPGYSLRQSYELWEGATKRTRLCDGIDEELSGGPCICNAQGDDRCDLYTRLVVALPELDTVLGWRLITRGANAGHELPTMMALIEAKAAGQAFVPARLRLDERRGVKDGQVIRYVVPTVDLGVGYLTLATPPNGETRALPATGYTPAPRRDPTVEQALNAVTSPPPPKTGGRQAAPIGPAHDDYEAAPLPVDDDAPPGAAKPPPKQIPEPGPRLLTDQQRRKMNALFRENGLAVREARLNYATKVIGRPLQSSTEFTVDEASQIIDALERREGYDPATAPFPVGY